MTAQDNSGRASAFWPLLAGFAVGMIVGAMLFAEASNGLDKDRIKAGAFQSDGIAYRITPLVAG